MLNELTGIVGKHFSVMSLTGLSRNVEVVLFCPVDDSRKGNSGPCCVMYLVPGIAVIVAADRGLRIIDELFVYGKLFEDILLHLFWNPFWGVPVIRDVEVLRILLELLQEYKESRVLYAEDTQHLLH